MKRIALTTAEERAVRRGVFVRVELGGWVTIGESQHAKSAFVGQFEGNLVAYYNFCQHQPVELDMPDEPEKPGAGRSRPLPKYRGAPMAEDGVHLLCHTHGALYRPLDGRCVLGPCYGASLIPVPIEESAEGIALLIVDK